MPAPASLSIPDLVDQLGGAELPNPITVAPELRTALAQVSDPRKPRGVRHGLVVVLTTAVCAVAAGARSFVAIAEWVADLPTGVSLEPCKPRVDQDRRSVIFTRPGRTTCESRSQYRRS